MQWRFPRSSSCCRAIMHRGLEASPPRASHLDCRAFSPWAPRSTDAMIDVRLRMPARACLLLCLLIAAATASVPSVPAVADPRHVFVVIMPPARVPAPPPPASQDLPPKLWLPPAAMGPMPGAPSPAALCYAGANVCPLARPGQAGQAWTCTAPGGPMTGRALIPPSHDVIGHSARNVQ